MANTVRMNLNVDPETPGLLAGLAGGNKKMGAYLSDLVRSVHAGQLVREGPGEIELLTAATRHLSAKVKELDGRIEQLEQKG